VAPRGSSEELARALARLERAAEALGKTVALMIRDHPGEARALADVLEMHHADDQLGSDQNRIRHRPDLPAGVG